MPQPLKPSFNIHYQVKKANWNEMFEVPLTIKIKQLQFTMKLKKTSNEDLNLIQKIYCNTTQAVSHWLPTMVARVQTWV
jgi:hypothetical protein